MNPEQWLSLKWNGGSTMSDRWLNQSKIIQFVSFTVIFSSLIALIFNCSSLILFFSFSVICISLCFFYLHGFILHYYTFIYNMLLHFIPYVLNSYL